MKTKIRKRISCKTLFISTGIKTDYPVINLEKGEVIVYITYKGKTYMRIQYNVLTEETKVNGSVETIKLNRLFKNKVTLNDAEYIDTVQSAAQFFIENEIENLNEYFKKIK